MFHTKNSRRLDCLNFKSTLIFYWNLLTILKNIFKSWLLTLWVFLIRSFEAFKIVKILFITIILIFQIRFINFSILFCITNEDSFHFLLIFTFRNRSFSFFESEFKLLLIFCHFFLKESLEIKRLFGRFIVVDYFFYFCICFSSLWGNIGFETDCT